MTSASESPEDFDRLLQEFLDRARRGEAPPIEDYARAHPALADDIRELFPVLAVVEGLKGEPASASRSEAEPAGSGTPLPDRVGPFRIVREIGQGGMGVVYEGIREDLAEDDEGARVAIKVVHPHLLEDAANVARFLQEAEAGSRVAHPNVVRTLSTGLHDLDGAELPYIVLEYVDGHNLRALLHEVGVVPERLCRHVAVRMAEALSAVHAAGLVHRDVKPENVVITPDETVKLMDLGVAVLQDTAYRLSQTGQFVGTLLYAAPGQIAGEDPDPTWDLQALGTLLYELATGQHPARARPRTWLARGRSTRRSASPRESNPRISAFFDEVILSLLAPPDGDGIRTAAELREIVGGGEHSAWWRQRRGRTAPSAGRLRGLERPTLFVGRSREWQALDEQWAAVQAGSGKVALLVGEAGMGKTRLLHEWLAATEAGPDAPHALVVSHGPGSIEEAEGGLAAALLQVLGEDDLEPRLRELLGTRARLASAFAHHLRGRIGESGEDTLDPARRDAAYVHVLSALAADRGVILAYEDLHFASDEARRLFVLFAHALARHRVLLIGTMRPVPVPAQARALDGLSHVYRIPLEGLDTRACRDLLREASRQCPRLDVDAARLSDRTDRNPYFILEFVRECMKRNADEDLGLDAATEIPRSVRGFLAMRLADLDPSDRELLEAAACCGHEFDPVVVADAAGLGRIAALKRFGHLERVQGLLHPEGRRYRFRHHLVQELLLDEVHPALAEAYHAALGSALEAQTEILSGGARAVALSTHFLAGNEPARAGPHVRAALEHLLFEEADYTRLAQMAKDALAVEGLLGDADRAFALRSLAMEETTNGRPAEALALLDEALVLAERVADPALEARVHLARAWTYRALIQPDEANASHRLGAERARDAGEWSLVALGYGELGRDLMLQGRLDEAERALEDAFAAIRGRRDVPDIMAREGELLARLAAVKTRRGLLDEAEPLLLRGRDLAHSAGALVTEMYNLGELAQIATRRGRFAECLDIHLRTLEVERQLGRPHLEMDTLCNIAAQLATLGRLEEAQQRIDEAVAHAELRGNPSQRAHIQLRRGALRIAQADLAGALEDLRLALRGAVDLRRHTLLTSSAVALADVLGLLGRGSEALRMLEEASAALGAEPAPALVVLLGTARGQVLEREGRIAEAAETYRGLLSVATEGTTPHARLSLPLGRSQLHLGHYADAADSLRAAGTWGRASGDVRHTVVAQAWCASLPEGDPLAAKVVFEEHGASLPWPDRVEAAYALWRATQDAEHLEAAWEGARRLRDGAPPEDRDAVVAKVHLHREIAEARRE